MSSWGELLSEKRRAIGEVASVEGGKIEIFVYPEFYPRVHIGSVLIVDSEETKPIGLALKLAHSARHGQMVPLHRTRSEISDMYPDIEKYHRFVSTMAYTSHLRGDEIIHVRSSMPKLHDLVFLVDSKSLLVRFFKPKDIWDFSFMRYYVAEGASYLELREFFYHHREFFSDFLSEKDEIVSRVVYALIKSGIRDIAGFLEDINEVLGW